MNELKGKVAIITGASSEFGLGTAYKFAKAGCNLIITAQKVIQLAIDKYQHNLEEFKKVRDISISADQPEHK